MPSGESAPKLGHGDQQRLSLALAAGRMGTWEWDVASGALSWSEQLGPMHGLAPGETPENFDAFLALIHPDDQNTLMAAIQSAMEQGGEFNIEFRIPWTDGTDHWIAGRGSVTTDENGNPLRMIGLGMDITEQKLLLESERTAREAAERANDRLKFLAEAGKLLSLSLNYKETLKRITHLVVPRLGDWCGIDMVRADGTAEWVAGTHVDPAKEEMIGILRARYPTDMEGEGIQEVMRTGEGQLYPVVNDEMVRAGAKDERHAEMLLALGLTSVMIVPLSVRGKVIGLLSLLSSTDHHFDEDDLALAMELGQRCAASVENSRLYEERSSIARILQRSLLPPDLPDIPGVTMAASYLPAGEGNEVGGDFYDVFDSGHGGWALAIGDVCGKGPSAASLTGLARHTIRAAALRSPHPADVVPALNQAIFRDSKDFEFLTMVYGRLQFIDGNCVVTACIAGHPAPMIVRSTGAVDLVGREGDLLGVMESVDVLEDKVTLNPGDTLVMYTDGVIEARQEQMAFGEGRLKKLLASCAGLDPKAITQKIEEVVLEFGGRARDDIALLVVRAD